MGSLSNKLLEGQRNKCIDYYLSEIPERYRAAVRAGFPALPKTIVSIHIEMAVRYFDELEIRLRYKDNYSQTEIGGYLQHAEEIALATACSQLNLDYEECEGILANTANDLAQSYYDKELTPEQNFSKICRKKELQGKSVLWRNYVFLAMKFLESEIKVPKPNPNHPIQANANQDKVKKPGKEEPKNAAKPIVEVINYLNVRKPGTTKPVEEVKSTIQYEESTRKAESKRQAKNRKAARTREPAWHFSVPINGWTWYCEYHDIYGLAVDYDECLFMFGAHMHYYEIDGDVCEPHFKEWLEDV